MTAPLIKITDEDTNPSEVRLEKYVDLAEPDDVVGIQACRVRQVCVVI